MKALNLKKHSLSSLVLALATGLAHGVDLSVSTLNDDSYDGGTITTETLDGGGLSLREAIGLANNNGADAGDEDGDTISFSVLPVNPTINLSSEIEITDDVTIDGELPGGVAQIILNAGGTSRIFSVNTAAAPGTSGLLALSSITLNNGSIAAQGGAMKINPDSEVELNSGTLLTNNVAEDGGGIFNEGSLTINDVGFSRNQANAASGSGGAIFNAAGGRLEVSNSTFSGNSAVRAGGAVEDQAGAGGLSTFVDTDFEDNSVTDGAIAAAPGNGGAIHITGPSSMTITRGSATGNIAQREGGAFWNGSGIMTVDQVTISNNTASGNTADDGGGGIFNNGGTLMVNGGVISGNIADGTSGSGGGIFSTDGMVTISNNCIISANTANRAGGGIEIIDGTLLVVDSTLGGDPGLGNVAGPAGTAAPGNGGAVHISNRCNSTFSGVTISNNTAAREGGGLWNSGPGTMKVDSGTIVNGNLAEGDAADDGGGGIFNNGGILIIEGSAGQVVLRGNIADGTAGSGGGLFNATNGRITISDAMFSSNRANRAGGAIEDNAGADGAALISNTSFLTNLAGIAPAVAAPGNGGAIHISGTGNMTLTDCSASENRAASEGGAYWNSLGTMTITGGTIQENIASGDAADNGGGGVFNNGGTLDISEAFISGNKADGASGSGGGIFNDGTLNLKNSTLTVNTANRAGGGIEAIAASSTMVSTSLVTENIAGPAGSAAPGNGGGFHLTGNGFINVTSSTFSSNQAANEGGGLWNSGVGQMEIFSTTVNNNDSPDGGGLFQQAGAGGLLETVNSTISGNSGTLGGGIRLEGAEVVLLNTTVTNNTIEPGGDATAAGGVSVAAGTFDMINSIVGGNGPTDLTGTINESFHSLLQDATGATGITDGADGNIVGADPLLAPLADNGGPTQTHLIDCESPARNAGQDSFAIALPEDQRGSKFPRIYAGQVDMGAVELVLTTFDDWASMAFDPGTPAADRLPGANPDGDARSNFIEFLTGSDPENGTDTAAVSATLDSNGFLTFSYDFVTDRKEGIDGVEISDDLVIWNPAPAPSRVANPSGTPGTDRITVTLSSTEQKVFARIFQDLN